jgi:hypothetical protein
LLKYNYCDEVWLKPRNFADCPLAKANGNELFATL